MSTATITPWSAEQVTALAPDNQVATAGLKLASPTTWSDTGVHEALAWGSASGSGKRPYRVCVDLSGPAFKCSCPSRKFPCKHAIGLLHLWSRGEVSDGEPAAFAVEWMEGRTKRTQQKAARQQAANDPDDPDRAAAAARSAASRARTRERRITDGLADLDRWLTDQLREGLANGSAQRSKQLTAFASRMVDAQAPGVARRLNTVSRLSISSPDWPERLLDELGMLHLLIRAWNRREQLPEDLVATVRSHLGITVRTEDVLASPGVSDTWVVVAGRDSVEGKLTERRLWLYGTTTHRWGLLLFFSPVSSGLPTTLVPGTRLDAVAHVYPGRGQLRVVLSDKHPAQPVTGWEPETMGTVAAREIWRRAIAADPWVEAVPVLVSGRFQLLDGGSLAIGDSDGVLPIITPGDARWVLPLLTDGDEVTIAGELSTEGLWALSVLTAGEVRAL
ncbi:SWIM zinc finger family protein [Actinomyces viscosus]|nr:SWIM zinc finger family protein [Actinomyces viscosus]TFH51040.1 SWIM zinc finger family protein [Actinomyces viscosus]